MNEQEYINVSNRTRLTNVLQILNEIMPDKSGVIDQPELQQVMVTLQNWEEQLLIRIRIK